MSHNMSKLVQGWASILNISIYKFGSNDAQSGIELIATTSLKDPSLSIQNPSFQPVVSTLPLKFMDGGEHIESLKLSPR